MASYENYTLGADERIMIKILILIIALKTDWTYEVEELSSLKLNVKLNSLLVKNASWVRHVKLSIVRRTVASLT